MINIAPPSEPRNVRVIEVYKDFMIVAWELPETDGGSEITGYQVEKSLSGGVFVNTGCVFNTIQLLLYCKV